MRTGISVSLVLLGLASCIVNITPLPPGSDCVIGTKPGVCKKISECDSAWNKLACDDVQPRGEDVCCYVKLEKVVCCPKTDPVNVTTRCSQDKRLPKRISLGVVGKEYAKSKSDEMCRRYSGFKTLLREVGAGGEEDGLNRIARSLDSVRTGSLPEDYNDEYEMHIRITNGTRAHNSEFPHMAAIGFNASDTDIKWSCGGTLISDFFVLTAGHCLRDRGSVATWVQLGSAALNVHDPDNRYAVVERIPHPEYTPPALYNDIGLLRLGRRVTMDLAVHPACLQAERVTEGLKCTATGWGITDWANPKMSPDLLKVLIQVQNVTKCNSSFDALTRTGKKLVRGVHDESTICAGDPKGDTCQGDSGGPITVKLPHIADMYVVIGVTSFGVKACGTGQPALYSRVSYFLPWIVGHVWPPEPKPVTPRPRVGWIFP